MVTKRGRMGVVIFAKKPELAAFRTISYKDEGLEKSDAEDCFLCRAFFYRTTKKYQLDAPSEST